LLAFPSSGHLESLPGTTADGAHWRMVSELSESGGRFQQQFTSNEDSFQSVIPALKDGGVCKNGFIVDIRRD
jgi:hypothetical protein